MVKGNRLSSYSDSYLVVKVLYADPACTDTTRRDEDVGILAPIRRWHVGTAPAGQSSPFLGGVEEQEAMLHTTSCVRHNNGSRKPFSMLFILVCKCFDKYPTSLFASNLSNTMNVSLVL